MEKKDSFFVWTNHREKLIYASLIDVLHQQDFVKIVCPYIDIRVFQELDKLELIRGREIQLVTRVYNPYRTKKGTVYRLNKKVQTTLDYLKKNLKDIEVRYTKKSPVHAKLLLSENCTTVTSANLIPTSLKRNFELGSAYFGRDKIQRVGEVFNDIWEDPNQNIVRFSNNAGTWVVN